MSKSLPKHKNLFVSTCTCAELLCHFSYGRKLRVYCIYVTYYIMIYSKCKQKLITSQPLIKLPCSQRRIKSRVLSIMIATCVLNVGAAVVFYFNALGLLCPILIASRLKIRFKLVTLVDFLQIG